MGLHLVMEAMARIEHKLDALMRWTGVPMPPPMHFGGTMCPACGNLIDYQVDFQHGVVVRRCDCKTGKVPSTIPLLPVQSKKEQSNGAADPGRDEAELGAQREGRGPGPR